MAARRRGGIATLARPMGRHLPTRWLVLALAGAALAVAPAAAEADADPASDILLTQNAFFYSPPVSAGVGNALLKITAEAATAGFPIKVATVPLPQDLGAVTDLFDQPQRYATFLASEISFNRKEEVLVVMPSGFGTANLPPSTANALKGLTVDRTNSDTLTTSAITAVEKLSAAAGHPLVPPKIAGTSSGKSSGVSPALAFGAPVVLVLLAGGVAALLRSRKDEEDELDDEDEDELDEEDGNDELDDLDKRDDDAPPGEKGSVR
jgi:hypothetical protein